MESTDDIVKHIQASLQSDNPYGVPKFLVLKLLEEYLELKHIMDSLEK